MTKCCSKIKAICTSVEVIHEWVLLLYTQLIKQIFSCFSQKKVHLNLQPFTDHFSHPQFPIPRCDSTCILIICQSLLENAWESRTIILISTALIAHGQFIKWLILHVPRWLLVILIKVWDKKNSNLWGTWWNNEN